MSVWWKKVEFHQGKSNSNCSMVSGADPWWGFRGQSSNFFHLFNISKTIKCRQWHYKSIFMAEEAILVHKQPFCSGERGFHLPPPFLKHPLLDPACPFLKFFSPPLFSISPPFQVFQIVPHSHADNPPPVLIDTPTFLTYTHSFIIRQPTITFF